MGPTSSTLQWTLASLAAGSSLLVGYLIWKWRTDEFMSTRRRTVGAVAAGLGLVLLAQTAAVGAVAVNLNRSLGIFLDWRAVVTGMGGGTAGLAEDLGVGVEPPSVGQPSSEQERLVEKQGWFPAPKQPKTGDGSYRVYPVTGRKTGLRKDVVVWIPAGVKANELAKLPVVMNLSGAYGSPLGFLNKSEFASNASALIRAHKVPRFLGVAPMVNVAMPSDTECTDYPDGGPQAFTWLADDVRTWAHATLKVPLDRKTWTVQGVSLGGYCSAKLQAARPDAFSAGAAVLGFFEPELDGTTLGLREALASNQRLRQQSSVQWLVRNHTPDKQLRLLVVSSSSDPQSYPQFKQFRSQEGDRRNVTFLSVPALPHTNASMGQVQDKTLPYLLGAPDANARTP